MVFPVPDFFQNRLSIFANIQKKYNKSPADLFVVTDGLGAGLNFFRGRQEKSGRACTSLLRYPVLFRRTNPNAMTGRYPDRHYLWEPKKITNINPKIALRKNVGNFF
jgi:hypothetical protein